MAKIQTAKLWTLNYRLVMSVIVDVASDIAALGLEPKELFVLGAIDEHPYPAEIAESLCMPKPTVTLHLKRLERAGFVRREIDVTDLRRYRLSVTPAGRKVVTRGFTLLSDAFGRRLCRLSTAEQAQLFQLLQKLS